VFGLFAISVLTKLRFNFRKLLEAVILGQFVIERFLSEVKPPLAQAQGSGFRVQGRFRVSACRV